MALDQDDLRDVLQASIVITFVLYMKTLFVFLVLGSKKTFAGRRAPEDPYNRKPGSPEEQEAADALLDRWQRMTNNDMENVYPAIMVIWASVQVMIFFGDDKHAQAHIILASIHGLARILYTFFYAFVFPLPRTMSYMVGMISIIAMLCNATAAIF